MGRALMEQHPKSWRTMLVPLKDIDWSRTNPMWEGRALNNGVLKKARANIILTANILKQAVGLELDTQEQALESRHVAAA